MLADPNVAASSGNLSPASTINSDSAPELSLVHTFPLYFRVLLLAVLGVWAWATNIHGLEAAGISVGTILSDDTQDDTTASTAGWMSFLRVKRRRRGRSRADSDLMPINAALANSNSNSNSNSNGRSSDIMLTTRNSDAQFNHSDNNDDSMSAPKRRPGYVPVYKIAATLSLLWIIGITLYGMLMRRSDTIDRAVTIAILAYVVFFFLVFQPFNWLEKSTRMAFAKSLRRIIFDPPWAARVLLSDVILADILTSFARVFADTYATGCDFYYHMFVTKSAPVTVIPSPTSNSSSAPSTDTTIITVEDVWDPARTDLYDFEGCNYTTVAPYLVSLPFLFRLRQCITEVYRAKHPVDRRRHIMNALKYLSALPVIFLSAAQKEVLDIIAYEMDDTLAAADLKNGNKIGPRSTTMTFKDAMNSRLGVLFVCWSVAVIVNTLYSFYWDIAMDFDLGHISGRRAPAFVQELVDGGHPGNSGSSSQSQDSTSDRRKRRWWWSASSWLQSTNTESYESVGSNEEADIDGELSDAGDSDSDDESGSGSGRTNTSAGSLASNVLFDADDNDDATVTNIMKIAVPTGKPRSRTSSRITSGTGTPKQLAQMSRTPSVNVEDIDPAALGPTTVIDSLSAPLASARQPTQQNAFSYSAKSFPFMLRPRLHFPDPMLYYTAIALDFILRIAWTLKLSWHLRIDTMTFGPFLMAFIEILRRWMWVYFRLEREWVYRELRSDQH